MKGLMILAGLISFSSCHAQVVTKDKGQVPEQGAVAKEADTTGTSGIFIQKAQEGVDFVAMGNEPSWALEIDFEKSMIFTSLNEPDTVVTPVPEGLLRDNLTATSFTAETENGSLGITISEQPCTDAMSGEAFDYTVSVSAKTNELAEPLQYDGCGRYLNSSPLNGVWQLSTLNGQKASKLFGESIPFLEFRIGENKVVGSGGCNRLSGSLELKNGTIIFSPIISTKMACPAIAAEQQLLNILSEKELEFSIKNEALVLKSGADQVIFERMEKTPEK